RDAMPEGGRIGIGTSLFSSKGVRPPDPAPGDYVRVSVTDTGSGMEKAVIERAFDPFFTTREPGKGAGLGLSMVYGFARQSGGDASIESEPGKGSAVHLYLPLAAAAGT